ncbi:MAG: Hsp20/alpha crystallin family protein [Phycisphaerales bacterium]|nr:Hsp20/alpha crystallin family protein [Phycisphaerales bacterium]
MPGNIIRRDPFEMFSPVEGLINRLFQEPFGASLPMIEEGALALDISETDDALIIRASLPGFRKEDVNIEVHEGVLTISATREQETEERNEKFYRRERRTGSVSRRVALPSMVTDDQADAELKDGVLTLRLPKSKKDSPKKISVK